MLNETVLFWGTATMIVSISAVTIVGVVLHMFFPEEVLSIVDDAIEAPLVKIRRLFMVEARTAED